MSSAISSGVSGLAAFQQLIDVAGNNLANSSTTAYKSSTVTFSECMSRTLADASAPTSTSGGTNPLQVGTGVTVGSIMRDTGQGSIENTGNALDVAIDGEGYFVVSNGMETLYTRAGSFSVDGDGYLVDSATGYRVERIGTTGESEGFQITGDSDIQIPYDTALPASATTEVTFLGNCSADATGTAQAQTLASNVSYSTDDGDEATVDTEIDQLDQFSGGSGTDGELGTGQTGTITIAGYSQDGTAISGSFTVTGTSTMGDLIDYLNSSVLVGATASFDDGKIIVTDNEAGYSLTDISMSYAGDGSLTTPGYFEMTTVGGDEVVNTNITVYDSLGGSHVLSVALVRTDTANTWDVVLTSATGDIASIDMADRRVSGLTFDPDTGAFVEIPDGEDAEFALSFAFDATDSQTISLNFGTEGSFDGLTQFAGNSTAVADDQDGYEAGNLTSVSVSDDGVILGTFSNGEKRNIATLAVALFNNASGLKSEGNNYYSASANSGRASLAQAGTSGAGAIQGSALEGSNVDTSTEFVKLIEAQNGYQANARAITVANDILQELMNLIR